ncbi:MAG: hypothetical protein QXU18_00570 [Thermoplasmatales archaeon]
MKTVDLVRLDSDLSFRVKMEAYLYGDANTMLKSGKGDSEKLRVYMEKRIEKIEELLTVKRPFKIVDDGVKILEVIQ